MEDCFPGNDDQDGDRVVLNIGGVRFETYITTLQNIADTRLAWLTENVEEETLSKREFFFDRHPGAFVYIMNFYRTGKLHTPRDMCGPAFEEELQFWGIDEKQMEPCCWETFTKHREAEVNLKTFEGPGFEDLHATCRKYSTFTTSYDDRRCLQKEMSTLWDILNDPHSSELAKRFSLLSCFMIIISLSVYCLTTMNSLKQNAALLWINHICLVFFTLEFVTRVIVCPSKVEFIKEYKNWIDLFSIIPTVLLIPFSTAPWIQNLVIIRLLRVFKFFKLSYGLQVLVHTLKASSYELTLLLLVLLIPLVVFSSLVYAVESTWDDKTTDFDSIPRSFWWCIITMTTVGYGDITPKTWPGQLIGSICAIIGVLIIALPISVIGSNFTLYYAHVRARLKLPKKNHPLLQGRLRGLLRQPALLSSRDRDRKTIKRNGSSLFGSSLGDHLTVDHATSPHVNVRRERACMYPVVSNISIAVRDSDSPSVESNHENYEIGESDNVINNNINSNNINDNNTTINNNNSNNNGNNNGNDDKNIKQTPNHIICDNNKAIKQSNDLTRIVEENRRPGDNNISHLRVGERNNPNEGNLHQPLVPPRSRNRNKVKTSVTYSNHHHLPMRSRRDALLSRSMVALPTDKSPDCEQDSKLCHSLTDFNCVHHQSLLAGSPALVEYDKESVPLILPPSLITPSQVPAAANTHLIEIQDDNNNIRRESMRKVSAISATNVPPPQPPPQPPMRTRSRTIGSYNEALQLRKTNLEKVEKNCISNPILDHLLLISNGSPSHSGTVATGINNNNDANNTCNNVGVSKRPLSPRISLRRTRKKSVKSKNLDSACGDEEEAQSRSGGKMLRTKSVDSERQLDFIRKESGI